MLSIGGLDVAIGATEILRGVDLEVPHGTMCGLIGRNGAGKTTLMRAIMGALRPTRGTMTLGDVDLCGIGPHDRAGHGIGYMPEDRRLVPQFTSEENILLPVWATHTKDYAERLAWIYGLLPEVEAFRSRPATSLSGGQQKMVAMARGLMAGHTLLLLDEPTEGIAPALARRMSQVMSDLKKVGASVLVAESNVKHVSDLLDRQYVIERGSVHLA